MAQEVQRVGSSEQILGAHSADGAARTRLERSASKLESQMNDTWVGPEYCIFSNSTGEPLHTVEMRVLARAYRATWRSLFASDPFGPHVIGALDVLIVFSAGRIEGRQLAP